MASPLSFNGSRRSGSVCDPARAVLVAVQDDNRGERPDRCGDVRLFRDVARFVDHPQFPAPARVGIARRQAEVVVQKAAVDSRGAVGDECFASRADRYRRCRRCVGVGMAGDPGPDTVCAARMDPQFADAFLDVAGERRIDRAIACDDRGAGVTSEFERGLPRMRLPARMGAACKPRPRRAREAAVAESRSPGASEPMRPSAAYPNERARSTRSRRCR